MYCFLASRKTGRLLQPNSLSCSLNYITWCCQGQWSYCKAVAERGLRLLPGWICTSVVFVYAPLPPLHFFFTGLAKAEPVVRIFEHAYLAQFPHRDKCRNLAKPNKTTMKLHSGYIRSAMAATVQSVSRYCGPVLAIFSVLWPYKWDLMGGDLSLGLGSPNSQVSPEDSLIRLIGVAGWRLLLCPHCAV